MSIWNNFLRMYFKEVIKDPDQQFFNRYEVYHDIGNNSFSSDDSILIFDGDDLIIKGILYEGSLGMYELLIRNRPIGYKKPTPMNTLIN